MDGNEDPLVAIPTEKLVLRLLQELAARVERLERVEDAGRRKGAPISSRQHTFTYKLLNEEQLNTNGTVTPKELYREWATEDNLPDTASGRRHAPYGSLLDGEDLNGVLKWPRDRLESVSDPEVAKQLRQLGGIAQVPADFRFELTNFWTLDASNQKDFISGAIEFLNVVALKGGNYWITDHDLNSNQVHYEYWSVPQNTLEGPVIHRNLAEDIAQSSPWRRVILLQGISEFSSQMQPGFLRKNGELVMTRQNPFFSAVSPTDAINMHLGKSFGTGLFLEGGYRFHLSWCRARRLPTHRAQSRQGPEELKVGRLYGSVDHYLCQEAYTIHAITDHHSNDFPLDDLRAERSAEYQQYWTILLLSPLGFYRRGLLKVPRVISNPSVSPLQINMIVLIGDALGAARRAWRGVHQHVDELLGTGTEIFDPELHDSLLSDDELFSGSRKYFWLINSLQTFDNILRQNMEAWISYRDKFLLPLNCALSELSTAGLTWQRELDEGIDLCDKLVEDLARVQRLFRDQRERTLALREGLFSASAVIESRASTRLGENVKLLTYVSIFYLPLAFCTSLWSTSDTFSFLNLAYVMVAVALATYILVFNLNSLVKASQAKYLSIKGNVVDQMINDPHASWMDTGMKFDRYKPRNMPKESKPSEWWVLLYQVLRVFRFIGISRNVEFTKGDDIGKIDSRDDTLSSVDHPINGEPPGQSWYRRLFHWRGIKETATS